MNPTKNIKEHFLFSVYFKHAVKMSLAAMRLGIGCFMDDMTLALLRSPWTMESKATNDSQSFALNESRYQV